MYLTHAGKEGREYVQMALGEVVRAVVHDTEVNDAEFILDSQCAYIPLMHCSSCL